MNNSKLAPTASKEKTTENKNGKRVVELRHHSYQPSKAELDEEFRIEATPEELTRALMREVTVRRKDKKT